MQNPQIKVSRLSNSELLARFGKLVRTERKITHLVLECIAEIDSRRLYLDKAHPSLYEFLVHGFGYSSSAALRRIESARLLREVPEVARKIESGALNLSQLSKVQQAVRTAQKIKNRKLEVSEKKELLRRIERATQQQTEVILHQALSLPVTAEERAVLHGDGAVTLMIYLSKEEIQTLRRAQDLISHAVPEKKWAKSLAYLAQKEINSRTRLKAKSATSAPVAGAGARKPVSAVARKTVLNQQGCCQYRDPDTGRICGSTRFLQTDHRQSVWAGGSSDVGNLQNLCAQHNRHKYRRESFLKNAPRARSHP